MEQAPVKFGSPADLATTTGLLLGADSMRRDGLAGVSEFMLSRACDLVDGWLARRFGGSQYGPTYDACADKALMAAVMVKTWRNDTVPKALIIATAMQNTVNTIATGVTAQRHPEIEQRPPQPGKLSMALVNASFFGYMIGGAVERSHPKVSKAAKAAGFITGVFGVGMGLHANGAYIKRAIGPYSNTQDYCR